MLVIMKWVEHLKGKLIGVNQTNKHDERLPVIKALKEIAVISELVSSANNSFHDE